MKRKSIALLSAVLSGLLLFSACAAKNQTTPEVKKETGNVSKPITDLISAADPSKNPKVALDRKDTIVIGTTEPKGVFNPLWSTSAYDTYVNGIVFDSLNTLTGDGKPDKWMADLPTITDGGKKYTFKMIKDAKFTDGKPVTMDDVAFTFTLMADATYTGPTDMNKLNLVGWKDYKEGKADKIAGIKVVDPKTIEFTLAEPNAQAVYTLGGTGILPKHYYGKDYKQGNSKALEALHGAPLGSGPYVFKEYKKGQEVTFVANDSYFMGAPKIKNVIYKVTSSKTQIAQLQSGEIDLDTITVNNDNLNSIKSVGFLGAQVYPNNGYGYIAFNMKDPKYADPKVRQALAYGLDRAGIAKAIYDEHAVVPDIPQSQVSWAYTDKITKYNFDLEKAGKLMDEAGWKLENGKRVKDGKNFKITFSPTQENDGPFNDALISKVRDNWTKLGIEVTIDTVAFNALIDKAEKGDFDTFFMAWSLTADPDPTNVFATTGSQNRNKYSNAKVDELAKKGLLETDFEKRKVIYEQLYQEMNKDLPYVFVYQRKNAIAVNARVKGIEATPYRSFYYDLYKASLGDK